MVVHNNRIAKNIGKWGLPGGRVEPGENVGDTAIRELREELYIDVPHLTEVGEFRYKGHNHKVYCTDFDALILRFDRSEILKIGWHTLDQVRMLEDHDKLHTGFERVAIENFLDLG
jgi:8-oxo-dGTP diphosphatase